ncbi:sulfatase, partial [bacterium]|nr:sulfatase [bacterium]
MILISIDGLRADHLAAYGYSERTAPVFSFIAGKAARFANAYTTAPWTLPAYVSMLSGLYPADHGAVRDDTFPKMGVTLIAERLREAGFKTAAFVTNPYLTKQRGFGQGFDSFVVVPGGDSSAAAEKAAAWLENNATSRVFLFVQFSDPLPPFAPAPERVAKFYPPNLPPYRGGPMDLLDIVDDWPKEEAKRHRRGVIALYDAEINAADAALGALYQTIQERRLDRTATTIVTSPHGMAFMEHGLIGYGTDLHDEQVRVPLAVMTPGHEDAHARIVERVSIVDIAPTLFDAAGFEIPEGLPGASILPLIRRGKDDAGAIAAFRGRPIFMETTVRGPDRIAVVRGDEKYIASPEFAIGGANFGDRLYDLLSDPAEGTNRLDADPGASQSFERELEISGRYRKRRVWSVRFGGNDGGLFTGVVKSAGRFIEVYKDKTIVRRAGQRRQ